MEEEPYSCHDRAGYSKTGFRRRPDCSALLDSPVSPMPVAFGQMRPSTWEHHRQPSSNGRSGKERLEFEVASVRRNKSEDEASMNISPLAWGWPRSSRKLIPGKKYKAYPIHRICLQSYANPAAVPRVTCAMDD